MNLRLLTNRASLLSAITLFVVSLACTQVPLLNYLGYEFSLCTAVIAGFVCGLLAISFWNHQSPNTDRGYWSYVKASMGTSFVVILLPLIVVTVNGFFVKNCSYTQGFRLFLLYVVPSVVFCIALATFSAVLARRWKKTLFTALFLLVLAQIPYVTLTRPQIFAFNPIVGYFPGLTYDETLGGEFRLLIYRVGTLAVSMLVLILSVVVRRVLHKNFRKDSSAPVLIRYSAIALTCFALSLGLYRMSDSLGLSSSERYIATQLGGIQYTGHFKIVYPKEAMTTAKLRRIVLLHEYLYRQLCSEFGIDPERRITVFLYANAKQKERLVGAGRTDFTKPWLRQVYINLDDVDDALKHELVHAMLAEEGLPVLQVAPNSGLIEGAAVAAQRFEYGESLHHLAAQIFALGVNPDVASMFTLSGFFKAYPGVSYVLAGSFCRYLIDRYGIDKFKDLYGSGAFESTYRKNVRSLVEEWKKVIQSTQLTRADMAKAAYLFKRAPLYGKECARVIANLNAETQRLLGARNYAQADASAKESLRLSRTASAVYQESVALFRLGKYDSTIHFASQQLADTTINFSLLPLRLTLGDAYWAVDDYKNAGVQYAGLLADSLSLLWEESVAIRLEILSHPTSREAFKPYFLTDLRDSARVALLESFRDSQDADEIARYLLGREYYQKGNSRETIQELRLLPPMKSAILEFLRNVRIAQAMYDLGDLEQAKLHYWRALNYTANEAEFYEVQDALRRCMWIQEHFW